MFCEEEYQHRERDGGEAWLHSMVLFFFRFSFFSVFVFYDIVLYIVKSINDLEYIQYSVVSNFSRATTVPVFLFKMYVF